MLSFNQCKKILNKDRTVKLTDKQVEETVKLLRLLAGQSVELFKNQYQDEKSSDHVSGE
jgi:hypothetical protein